MHRVLKRVGVGEARYSPHTFLQFLHLPNEDNGPCPPPTLGQTLLPAQVGKQLFLCLGALQVALDPSRSSSSRSLPLLHSSSRIALGTAPGGLGKHTRTYARTRARTHARTRVPLSGSHETHLHWHSRPRMHGSIPGSAFLREPARERDMAHPHGWEARGSCLRA